MGYLLSVCTSFRFRSCPALSKFATLSAPPQRPANVFVLEESGHTVDVAGLVFVLCFRLGLWSVEGVRQSKGLVSAQQTELESRGWIIDLDRRYSTVLY